MDLVAMDEGLARDARAVQEGAKARARVDDEEAFTLAHDLGMLARDVGICEHEVVLVMSSHAKRKAGEGDVLGPRRLRHHQSCDVHPCGPSPARRPARSYPSRAKAAMHQRGR